MNLKKMLAGSIIGGFLFFFLSWLIYGIILKNYMDSYSNPDLMRSPEKVVWWALIVSNLGWGFLLTTLLLKWNLPDILSGFRTGAWLGFILATAIDTGLYATYQLAPTIIPILIDILASVFIWAFTAALLTWIFRKILIH